MKEYRILLPDLPVNFQMMSYLEVDKGGIDKRVHRCAYIKSDWFSPRGDGELIFVIPFISAYADLAVALSRFHEVRLLKMGPLLDKKKKNSVPEINSPGRIYSSLMSKGKRANLAFIEKNLLEFRFDESLLDVFFESGQNL
jgi:hypothetical protein